MTSRAKRYFLTVAEIVGSLSATLHSAADLVGDVANHIGGLDVREGGPEGGEDYVPGAEAPLDSLTQIDHNRTSRRGELHEDDNKMTHKVGFTAGRK